MCACLGDLIRLNGSVHTQISCECVRRGGALLYDIIFQLPAPVGRCRVVAPAGSPVHDRLAVAFGHVSVRLLAHELGPHAGAAAAAGHHVTARALTRTHGRTEDLRGTHSRERGVSNNANG